MKLDVDAYELHLARSRSGGFIRKGSGDRKAVKALQQRLGELGFNVSTDGIFGAETEKALRTFQDSRGAQVDGIVGKETLGKLLRATKPKGNTADPSIDAIAQVVAPGTPNPGARSGTGLGRLRAQQTGGGSNRSTRGRRKGAGGSGTTQKGPHGGTIDATGAERATAKTGPIGSTDVRTPTQASWERGGTRATDPASTQPQDNNPAFNQKHPRNHGKFAKKGDTGEQVQNTQVALNKTNKAGLKEDGIFGSKTAAAVKSFQSQQGLTVDGIVGPKTSASLRRRLRLARRVNAGTTGR